MYQAVKVSLGLARIIDIFDLDAVAIDDISEELHRMIGLRPCLYISALQEKKVVVGMEGDLGDTTALLLPISSGDNLVKIVRKSFIQVRNTLKQYIRIKKGETDAKNCFHRSRELRIYETFGAGHSLFSCPCP